MTAYYNEIDPLKAEVLREAIKAGAIAPGDVDERSIADVEPGDLVGYTQCHFFAGGGFWSLALRWAEWPDDRPVWTGSCPCPSFSAAGKGGGFDDPRHLWPHWDRLIDQSRPAVIFGEQADDAIGFGWLDLVQTDLEAKAYSVGAMVFGAHSVGAGHIRQRLYFCADAQTAERRIVSATDGPTRWREEVGGPCSPLHGTDTAATGSLSGTQRRVHSDEKIAGPRASEPQRSCDACDDSDTEERGLAMRRSTSRSARHPLFASKSGDSLDADGHGSLTRRQASEGIGYRKPVDAASGAIDRIDAIGARLQRHAGDVREWRGPGWLDSEQARSIAETGATRGFWADCDWWYGRDGKYRPIGPGIFPLAHGSPARVGRLRMYGDGIVVTAAQAFIESYCEARGL